MCHAAFWLMASLLQRQAYGAPAGSVRHTCTSGRPECDADHEQPRVAEQKREGKVG